MKSYFLDEPLEQIVRLATDIYKVFEESTRDELLLKMLWKRETIFKPNFSSLSAEDLLNNWEKYKASLVEEKALVVENLKKGILNHYEDRKIKEEKLEEYKNTLVAILKTTAEIKLFTAKMKNYLPLYNELKHFNAEWIIKNYR